MKNKPQNQYKRIGNRFFIKVPSGYAELAANYQTTFLPATVSFFNITDELLLRQLNSIPDFHITSKETHNADTDK
jgi:hypothetical protein